jgi:hypothetical protein
MTDLYALSPQENRQVIRGQKVKSRPLLLPLLASWLN